MLGISAIGENGDDVVLPGTAPEAKRKRSLVPLASMKHEVCCANMCLISLSTGPDSACLDKSREFINKTNFEQKQWLYDYLQIHSSYHNDDGWKYNFVIGTSKLCRGAFLTAIGCSSSTYYFVKNIYEKGERISEKDSKLGYMSPESKMAVSWLDVYAKEYGDRMPDTPKVHLPMCTTMQSIYLDMKESFETSGDTVISESHFYRLWRSHRPDVVIPKVSRMTKCSTCVAFKNRMATAKTKEEKNKIQKNRNQHLHLQRDERLKYYKHQQKAKLHPDKYLSVIIDGMDQSKTELPHTANKSSSFETLSKVKSHLVGVIVHGVGSYGYFDVQQYAHNANFTIAILLHTLMLLTTIPSTLYLQLDNCYRENKNKYMFGFLSLLVQLGVFKKVRVSYLMVGHTHEDVDQMFSRFSVWLRRHNAFTMPQMQRGFEVCSRKMMEAVTLSCVYNVSEWILPWLNDIKNHSQPHGYKMTMFEGYSTLFWRDWNSNSNWCKSGGRLLKGHPVGRPQMVIPDFMRTNITETNEDVQTANDDLFVDSHNVKRFWREFAEETQQEQITEPWPMATLMDKANVTTNHDEPTIYEPVQDVLAQVVIKERPLVLEELKVGDMCVIATDHPEWPQIVKVVSINGPSAVVQWYGGSITTEWTPCTVNVGKFQRLLTETVSLHQIQMHGWKLTPGMRLPKSVKDFCLTIKK